MSSLKTRRKNSYRHFQTKIGKSKYDDLYVEQQGICLICNDVMKHKDTFPNVYSSRLVAKRATIDHIFPLSLGGTNDISNLQLLCHSCNARKGNKI